MHDVLKAEGLVINHKRTERLYREEGLSLRRKRCRKLPAVARVPLSAPQGPDERWSMDFIHDQLATGRRFRCLTLVDDFTRQCLAILVDTSIGGTSVVAVLQRLALSSRLPKVITVDNGPEFTAKPFTTGLSAPALLSIISSRANRCRTPSSRASMAPSATTASTNIGLAPWPKPDSSSNTGALTTITASALKFLDPFYPEKGSATAAAVARRTLQNVGILPMATGEAISAPVQLCHRKLSGLPTALERVHRAGLQGLPWVAALATAYGALGLLLRGEWLIALALAGAYALMAPTPWAGQFLRYMLPVLPLLAIGLAVALAEVWRWRGWGRRWLSVPARVAVILLLLSIVVSRLEAIHTLYWASSDDSTFVDSRGRGHVARLFYMNADWRAMEHAATWLRRNVPPDSRLITVMPHWTYLRTGLQAVQPPYVADAGAVQDLVDSVPADYAIVGAERNDEGDLMGRYLMPAVRKYPDRWRIVYEDQQTGLRVYHRHGTANAESGAEVNEQ